MAQVYKKLEIDVNKEVTSIITAVQNDTKSRFLDVVLLDGSTAINLTGHEVRIYGKKADGTEFYNDGIITSATAGRCQFELTSQALAVAQDLEVQIIIFKDNVEILSTQPFTIHVVKSLLSDSAIESSNEYGALVVLYQNLYEAYDLMTTMVQNIGVPGEIAEQLTIDTMWDAWEYLCNYVSEDLTTLLQDAINNNSVDGVVQRLGTTTDTGGTATSGTISAKLNSLIVGSEEISGNVVSDNDIISACTNYTTLTMNNWSSHEVEILNVTGRGSIAYLKIVNPYVGEITTMKVYIDGELLLNFSATENKNKEITFGYLYYSSVMQKMVDLTPFADANNLTNISERTLNLPSFAKSLRIVVNTGSQSSSVVATVKYGLVG